jgi:hypothetical protein
MKTSRSDDPIFVSRMAGPAPVTHAPKQRVCLVCGRLRLSTSPHDRLHPACRKAVHALDDTTHSAALPGRRWR